MTVVGDALAGIRIVDLSMGWAGPLAARHMADMGADVIKVESCERFDWWRSWEATPEWIENDGAEKSTAFNTVNRNKRNITLDDVAGAGLYLLSDLSSGVTGELHYVDAGFNITCMPTDEESTDRLLASD